MGRHPGIDDSRNELLWNPGRPRLIDAELTLERNGDVVGRSWLRSTTETHFTARCPLSTRAERR